MRIISGKFKGFKYDPPVKKWPTRPTMDQAREALFNVLANRISFSEQKVLDVFGGTGSISLEFISRGCESVCMVERHFPCVQYIKGIINTLDISSNIELVRSDALKFLQKTQNRYSLIFMDPPYDYPLYNELIEIVNTRHLLFPGGCLIMEHDFRWDFNKYPEFTEVRKYGETYFSFFQEGTPEI